MIVIAAASGSISAEVSPERIPTHRGTIVILTHALTYNNPSPRSCALLRLLFSESPLSTWLSLLARYINELCLAQRFVRAPPDLGRSLCGPGMRVNQFHTKKRVQTVMTPMHMSATTSMARGHQRRNNDISSAVYSLHRRWYEGSADRLGNAPWAA